MHLRLATPEDLPQLREVYGKIVAHMEKTGLQIWDDVYPVCALAEDIAGRRLYILEEAGEILAAFALCSAHPGSSAISWKYGGQALYLDRLGVNIHHLRRGLGSLALQKAVELAGSLGAGSVRLFVVDRNEPAIRLYCKNGFTQAEGLYLEEIDASLTFREWGFEKCTGR